MIRLFERAARADWADNKNPSAVKMAVSPTSEEVVISQGKDTIILDEQQCRELGAALAVEAGIKRLVGKVFQ